MEAEYISRNLKVPFIIVQKGGKKCYLCENGVLFTDEEYKRGIDLSVEYETRSKGNELYDYEYAKNTGNLIELKKNNNIKKDIKIAEETRKVTEENVQTYGKEYRKETEVNLYSVKIIGFILAVTSVICMYVSTLHTATYLYDYVDIISAWLMSASVTAYSSTAFEVSVIFKHSRKYFLACLFVMLWVFVTFFSMATTVSVFYDRFNFAETQIAEDNKEIDSSKLALEMLQKKESDLRRAIEIKVKDIEYRQERDYATTAVRTELNKLEEALQKNLSEQQNVLEKTPEVKDSKIQRKESLFSFLGRLLKIEGGVVEFIMSTLSAIFVNLIAPLSIVAVTEMKKSDLTK